MATVSLENIQKRYGKLTVIPDVSLEIRDGEFVALVGPWSSPFEGARPYS